MQRPQVLARPRAGVAQLPQAFLVELEPALYDESGERAAVAQVAAALVRRHWQPQVPEPENNSLINGNSLFMPPNSNANITAVLWGISTDGPAQPLDARHEVFVHVHAGAGQVDADEVRTADLFGPPHGPSDLLSDFSVKKSSKKM